ncbi:MAG: hypothetical protein ACFE9A_20390, partial [Candidatus Hodarchaeota archaeon]
KLKLKSFFDILVIFALFCCKMRNNAINDLSAVQRSFNEVVIKISLYSSAIIEFHTFIPQFMKQDWTEDIED